MDEYKNHPGIASFTPLMEFQSEGRKQWTMKMKEQSTEIELDRVRRIYTLLADAFNISQEEFEAEWYVMENSLG